MFESAPEFWYGLLIGFFIGANVGMAYCSLCLIAKKRGWFYAAQKESSDGKIVRIR